MTTEIKKGDNPNDYINNRVMLLTLAKKEFELEGMAYTTLFSQFSSGSELVELIELKRAGIFDLGALVVPSDINSTPRDIFPSGREKAQIILNLAREAAKGNYFLADLDKLYYTAGNEPTENKLRIANLIAPKVFPQFKPSPSEQPSTPVEGVSSTETEAPKVEIAVEGTELAPMPEPTVKRKRGTNKKKSEPAPLVEETRPLQAEAISETTVVLLPSSTATSPTPEGFSVESLVRQLKPVLLEEIGKQLKERELELQNRQEAHLTSLIETLVPKFLNLVEPILKGVIIQKITPLLYHLDQQIRLSGADPDSPSYLQWPGDKHIEVYRGSQIPESLSPKALIVEVTTQPSGPSTLAVVAPKEPVISSPQPSVVPPAPKKYTPEELNQLKGDLAKLREIAETLGIPNAHRYSSPLVLIKAIQAKQG